MCPLISAHFHQLQQRLDGCKYHLVEVTLDPIFDRPPVLANYAARFDADASRWTIPTGDSRAVLNFAAKFGIVEPGDVIQSVDGKAVGSPSDVSSIVKKLSPGKTAALRVWSNGTRQLVAVHVGDEPDRSG